MYQYLTAYNNLDNEYDLQLTQELRKPINLRSSAGRPAVAR